MALPRENPMFTKSVPVSILCLTLTLGACTSGAPQSPMTVKASVSPAPIVGQVATWHIEISSRADAPNTTLQVEVSDGIEIVGGETNWTGHINEGQSVSIDLTIRVTKPGESTVYAQAFSRTSPEGGFGGGKRLFITSSADSANVVEDINRPQPTIPALMIDTGTSSPLITVTPAP